LFKEGKIEKKDKERDRPSMREKPKGLVNGSLKRVGRKKGDGRRKRCCQRNRNQVVGGHENGRDRCCLSQSTKELERK